MALHLAAGCAEHPARRDGADAGAAGARLHLRRAERARHASSLGKTTIVLYWFLEISFLSALRFAYRYFRYTRVRHHARTEEPRRRCWSAAPPTPRCCCAASKAARSSGSGRSACCRRRSPTAASRSATFRCWAASTISRTWSRDFARRGKPIARVVMTPSAFEPEAHPEIGADAGAPARTDRQPAAVAGERRCAAADAGRGRGPAAAAQREDRLRPARGAGERQVRDRHRRRRLDRLGDLRSRRRPSARRGC